MKKNQLMKLITEFRKILQEYEPEYWVKLVLRTVVGCSFYAIALTALAAFFNNSTFSQQEFITAAESIFWFLFNISIFYSAVKGKPKSRALIMAPDSGSIAEPYKASVWDEDEKNLTCAHEAGHVLVTFYATDIEIIESRAQEFNGYITIDNPDYHDITADYLYKRAMIYYGSAAAELMLLGRITTGCFGSDRADFESAEEYIQKALLLTDNEFLCTRGPAFDDAVNKKAAELYKKAKEVIEEHREELILLRDSLYEKGQLSGDEIALLLGERKKR